MVLSQDGWGRIIALIASSDGDLAGAEDALGSALEHAVSVWREQGVPANPEGWLYRVALNARKDVWKSAAARTSAVWDPEMHDGADSTGPSRARFPARRSEDGGFRRPGPAQIGRFDLQTAIQILHMAGVRSGRTDEPGWRCSTP
ncbi:MAG: hypothetical protein L0J17_12235 [Brevibacterium sp.]|uniref:hypothetical protein n=1 Tax=Brevibacterium sp. TaxID=1701 RepID=UPI002647B668|nr:hypothetical protein [Brevibacterium sp.]MDN5807021.1 hypothetical protein [Brevibacterium sp.]MDN5833411.1 hypothetical protein [Brevibacterium sp.]MDN5875922.1 hypothetical protein [Brevibacterium sp.]MDN5908911.1 hypothetical protein [Brevibacterium sp.]MDN6134052.1 hypothetical protein [Brevibacterium sp.]